jgi:uncharacterized protein with GYD domain
MPFYMTQFAYTPEALAALTKNPEDRSVHVKTLFEKLGGRMIGMYYCFGEYDGVIIGEAPDNVTEMAAALAGSSPGHLKAIKTTVLFSVSEAMEGMKKAGAITYPGVKG